MHSCIMFHLKQDEFYLKFDRMGKFGSSFSVTIWSRLNSKYQFYMTLYCKSMLFLTIFVLKSISEAGGAPDGKVFAFPAIFGQIHGPKW